MTHEKNWCSRAIYYCWLVHRKGLSPDVVVVDVSTSILNLRLLTTGSRNGQPTIRCLRRLVFGKMGGGLTTPSSRSLFLYSSPSHHTPEALAASFRSRFQINYVITHGRNSIIYHATDQQSNQSLALKRVTFQKSNCEQILQNSLKELSVLRRLGLHEHIVNLYCAYQSSASCYYAFTLLSGGDLRYHLQTHQSKKLRAAAIATAMTAMTVTATAPTPGSGSGVDHHIFNEQCVTYLVCCIGSALFHCHQKGIIHRDIKPENIGLDIFGRPYLLDFGISIGSSEVNYLPLSESSSGTLPYLAPEILAAGNCHSYQVDFWSLGVLAYELFYHCRPFHPHCPAVAIAFVTDNYKEMWERLKATDPLPLSSTNTDCPCPFRAHSPDVNSTISVFPSSSSLHYHSVDPGPEFLSLLHGLLDVRIPFRLGNRNHFSEFAAHPSFVLYGYQPLNTRHRDKPSPLAQHILPVYSLEDMDTSPAPTNLHSIFDSHNITSGGKALLSQFHYVRSSEEYREFHRTCRDWECHAVSHVPSNME